MFMIQPHARFGFRLKAQSGGFEEKIRGNHDLANVVYEIGVADNRAGLQM